MTIIKVSRDGKAIVKKKEDETVVPLVRISFLLQRRWPIIYVAIVFQGLLFVKGQIDVFTFLSFMKSSCLIEFPHVGVC